MKGKVAAGAVASVLMIAIVLVRIEDRRAAHATRPALPSPLVQPGLPSTGPSTTAAPAPTMEEPLLPPPPDPDPQHLPPGARAPVLSRIVTTEPVVFISIDDGWTRDPRVAALLHQKHIPATLFLIDRAARQDPGYFRRLQADGATIEDHTMDHPRMPTLPYARQVSEICQPLGDFQHLFGAMPRLFRPPYGLYNGATLRAANQCRIGAVIEWTATMANGRLSVVGGRLLPGDIVLLHFRPDLYENLQQLIGTIARDGLTVGRLESYLAFQTA